MAWTGGAAVADLAAIAAGLSAITTWHNEVYLCRYRQLENSQSPLGSALAQQELLRTPMTAELGVSAAEALRMVVTALEGKAVELRLPDEISGSVLLWLARLEAGGAHCSPSFLRSQLESVHVLLRRVTLAAKCAPPRVEPVASATPNGSLADDAVCTAIKKALAGGKTLTRAAIIRKVDQQMVTGDYENPPSKASTVRNRLRDMLAAGAVEQPMRGQYRLPK